MIAIRDRLTIAGLTGRIEPESDFQRLTRFLEVYVNEEEIR